MKETAKVITAQSGFAGDLLERDVFSKALTNVCQRLLDIGVPCDRGGHALPPNREQGSDRVSEMVQVYWLPEVVAGASSERLHGKLLGAETGDHDDWHGRL